MLKLTIRNIQKAIEKKNISDLPLFIVMKSFQKDLITKEKMVLYSVVGAPYNKAVIDVSRTQAKKLIELAGLVNTLKNKHGEIYDTPNEDFKNKYKNYLVQID